MVMTMAAAAAANPPKRQKFRLFQTQSNSRRRASAAASPLVIGRRPCSRSWAAREVSREGCSSKAEAGPVAVAGAVSSLASMRLHRSGG
jgi:hypothetical protein